MYVHYIAGRIQKKLPKAVGAQSVHGFGDHASQALSFARTALWCRTWVY